MSLSTGEARLRIPIDVPRGTGGFQPELVLEYSSGRGDGIFGVGWQLAFGEIKRADRFGTPSYNDATDRFELDGEVLVEEPVTGEFRTSTESFSRIVRSGDSWVVTFANGTEARFGATKETQIRRGGDTDPSDDDGPIYRWLLYEIEDVNGNVVRFSYDRGTDPGTAYPSQVEYTLRGGSLVGGVSRLVTFYYESRNDVTLSFRGGVLARVSQRAERIESTVAGALWRRRTMVYDATGYTTGRSRLTSTTLEGCEGTPAVCATMPPETITYTDDPAGAAWNSGNFYGQKLCGTFSAPATCTNWVNYSGSDGHDKGVRFADVDGDGLRDAVYAGEQTEASGVVTYAHGVYLNTGSAWVLDQAWSDALEAISFTSWEIHNGFIGTNCQIVQQDSGHFSFLGDHRGTKPFAGGGGWADDGQRWPGQAQLLDLNGDGRADFLASYEVGPIFCADPDPAQRVIPAKHVSEVWINTGSPTAGWVRHDELSDTLGPIFTSYGIEQGINNSGGLGPCTDRPDHTSQIVVVVGGSNCVMAYEYPHGTGFADLNGDRRPDLVSKRNVSFPLLHAETAAAVPLIEGAWLNTEQGWVDASSQYAPPHPLLSFASGVAADTGLRFADLNGDGLTDAIKSDVPVNLISDATTGDFEMADVWLNTGEGWCNTAGCPEGSRYQLPAGVSFARQRYSSADNPDWASEAWYVTLTDLRLVDLNGDGYRDLMHAEQYAGCFSDSGPQMKSWIHDPAAPAGSVWVADSRFDPPRALRSGTCEGSLQWTHAAPNRLVEINGDGIPDFLARFLALRLSSADFPDRLETFENGQGGKTTFAYVSPIAARDDALEAEAAQDAADPDRAEDGGPPLILWRPRPVVSQITVEGIHAASGGAHYEETFKYAYPLWCPSHVSHLGYRLIERTRDDASIEWTSFWQYHGRAGQKSRREIWEGGELRFSEDWDWDVVDGGGVPGSVAGAYVGRLVYEARRSDYAGQPGAERSLTYGYLDALSTDYGYNFVATVQIDRPSGSLTVTRTQEPADLDDWIVGRIATEVHEDGGVEYRNLALSYVPDRGLIDEVTRAVKARAAGVPPGETEFAVTSWAYDTYGNVLSQTDAENRTYFFCYDGSGASGVPNCPTTATATHTLRASVRDPLAGVSSFVADPATGDIRQVTRSWSGDSTWFDADPFGRPQTLWVQPGSHAIATRLETRNYEDAPTVFGSLTLGPYVERTQYASASDPTGIRTATYLDGLGRAIRRVYPTPAGFGGRATSYDHAGRPILETYDLPCTDAHCTELVPAPTSPAVATTYDALGRPVSVVTPDGDSVADYRAATRSQPAGGLAGGTFDLVIWRDGRGTLTQQLRDGGRAVFVDECANEAPGTNAASLTCSGADETFYTYEPTGEVRTIYDALVSADYSDPMHQLAYVYDTLGRITSIQDSDGGTSFTTYDLVGKVASVTNARGQETLYDYDLLDRLEAIDLPEAPAANDPVITYDPVTRRRDTVAQYGGYDVDHDYDAFGRESRRVFDTGGRTFVLDFEYDLLDRLTKVVYPSPGTDVTYQYEGAYLTAVCGLGDTADCEAAPDDYFVSDVTYDGLGRISTITERPGLRGFSYDPATYRLDGIDYDTVPDGAVVDLTYGYDGAGNVTSIADAHTGVGTDGLDASLTVTYDHRSRIESRSLLGDTTYFGYDPLGNLTHRDADSAGAAANQLYQHPSKPHAISELLGAAAKTYDYDADGNMTRRGSQYFKFDSQNRLACVGTASTPCEHLYKYTIDGSRYYHAESGVGGVIYLDDLFEWNSFTNTATAHVYAFGKRIASRVSANASLRSAWLPAAWPFPIDPAPLGWGLALLALGAGAFGLARLGIPGAIAARPLTSTLSVALATTLVAPNAWAGGPPSFGDGNNTWVRRWISHDHLGTAIAFTDATGATLHRRVFEPFGQVMEESTATEATATLFTGQQFDASADLYDFKARWYDAETGRFLSVDPVVQSLADPQVHNAYGYVRNDPLNRIDPDGRIIEPGFVGASDFGGFLGSLGNAVAVAIAAAVSESGDSPTVEGDSSTTSEFHQDAIPGAGIEGTDQLDPQADRPDSVRESQGEQQADGQLILTPVESFPDNFLDFVIGMNEGGDSVRRVQELELRGLTAEEVEEELENAIVRRAGQVLEQARRRREASSDSIIDRALRTIAKVRIGRLEKQQRVDRTALRIIRRRLGRDPDFGQLPDIE